MDRSKRVPSQGTIRRAVEGSLKLAEDVFSGHAGCLADAVRLLFAHAILNLNKQ
jgi:hypothetical protein